MLKPRGLYSRNSSQSSSQGDSLCHAKHGLSWARAIVLWTTIATTSMHTVDGRSAQTGRPSPRYCLHGRQDARFGETNGLVSDGYGYGVIPILHLAHEKCLPLLATFTWNTPPTRARTPSAIPICTQLCTLVEPLAPAAVHSVQRCTLNGQRPRMPDADQPISWRSENP